MLPKSKHPCYYVWKSMHDRCRNPRSRAWNDYGGRGIDVCERWDDFHTFAADMGERPDGYSIDRIDNNAGYSPENCRWADQKTQMRNRRVAVFVEIEGKSYRAIDLSDATGLKADTIIHRASLGLPYDQVVSSERMVYKPGLALGGKASGEVQKAKTHCPHGHEYTPENTIVTRQGWRRCRACFYAKEKRRLQRSKRAAKE